MPHSTIYDNLERDVWCLLGLPFDAIGLNGTIEKLYYSVRNNKPCFLSTPNTNFLIASQNDTAFRDSVISSDLSIIDGKPLVWIARMLSMPVSERVAGSDLIESLIDNKQRHEPMKAFFFGGQDGIAEIACEKLNMHTSGLQCAGSLNPGFGSLEEMSSPDIINTINKNDVDFVIVSLGAKKGQSWIEKNKLNINAPIISHLGAVVNFIAGSVKRSPKILQKSGLEWLWRIKEEPALWRRYLNDGLSLTKLLIFKVMPLSLLIFRNKKRSNDGVHITQVDEKNLNTIICDGYLGKRNIAAINDSLRKAISLSTNIKIIIKPGSYIDGAILAKLQFLHKELPDIGGKIEIVSQSRLATKVFHYSCCEYLLQ